jgi:glycine/D-amino acid oxidase-like deaminating enzyme
VVGAGIVGVFTALELAKQGCRVTLYDGWDPGHNRAASADFHRVTRSAHGSDELYTRWQWESRTRWLELGRDWGTELFRETGGLLLAEQGRSTWEAAAIPTLERLGIPVFRLSVDEAATRFPHINFQRVDFVLYEPHAGFVWARRALQRAFQEYLSLGGVFRLARPTTNPAERLELDGAPLPADRTVVAAGAWMGAMFRRTLGSVLKVVRQDVIYTAPPEATTRYHADNHPVWIDHGYPGYGIPDIDGLGFKAVIAWHETEIDLDNDDRVVEQGALYRSRQYLAYRFPELVGQPIMDQKACQIVMTPDTHFLLDFHPDHDDIVLAGGCAGSIFKHAPVVGEYVAGMAMGRWLPDERFTLANRRNLSLAESPTGR